MRKKRAWGRTIQKRQLSHQVESNKTTWLLRLTKSVIQKWNLALWSQKDHRNQISVKEAAASRACRPWAHFEGLSAAIQGKLQMKSNDNKKHDMRTFSQWLCNFFRMFYQGIYGNRRFSHWCQSSKTMYVQVCFQSCDPYPKYETLSWIIICEKVWNANMKHNSKYKQNTKRHGKISWVSNAELSYQNFQQMIILMSPFSRRVLA